MHTMQCLWPALLQNPQEGGHGWTGQRRPTQSNERQQLAQLIPLPLPLLLHLFPQHQHVHYYCNLIVFPDN